MTYLELIKTTLDFLSKEDLEKSYYEYWGLNGSAKAIAERKNRAKSAILYLVMEELITRGMTINNEIYEALKKSLTTYSFDFEKTVQNAQDMAEEEIINDPETLELISQMDDEYTEEEEKDEISQKIYNQFLIKTIEFSRSNRIYEEISKPINKIIFHTVTTIPELFFTTNGQKYLPSEYKNLNNIIKCHHLLNEKIAFYEMGDNNCELDSYDSLYYTTKALSVIFSIIEKNNYKAFRKLDEIDDYLHNIQTTDKQQSLICWEPDNIKDSIEIIYNTRDINELDLKSKALKIEPDNHDKFMDFILNDQELSQTFSNQEIALILLAYYNPYEENPVLDLKKNMSSIKRILEKDINQFQKERILKNFSNSKKKEEPPKQFIKK